MKKSAPAGPARRGRPAARRQYLRQAARRRLLDRVSQACAALLEDPQAMLDCVARCAAAAFGDLCIVSLLSDDGKWSAPAAVWHPDAAVLEAVRAALAQSSLGAAFPDAAARAIRAGRPELIPPADPEALRPVAGPALWSALEQAGLRARSALIAPLLMDERGLGALALFRARARQPAYSDADARLALELARRAAPAIAGARKLEQMRRALAAQQRAEADLRLAEERFANVFAASPAGLAITRDADRVFVAANEAFYRLFEFDAAEVIGRSSLELNMWTPEQRQRQIQAHLESDRPRIAEVQVRARSGRPLTVLLSSVPLDLAGAPHHLTTVIDITERKQAEEALRASEDRFKDVFETANVGKSITLPTGEIFVNQAFAEMLGYEREELARKTWQELTPPEEVEPIQAILAPLLAGERDTARFTKRYMRKDGASVWADVSVALRRGADGRPLHYITTIVDITERTRAEQALRESEERYAVLFEKSAFVAALSRLPDGVLVAVNEAFENAFGFTRQEVLGRTTLELGINPDGETRARLLAVLQTGGAAHNMEMRLRTRAGAERVFLANVAAVDIGGQAYILNTLQDITERRQAEEQARYQAGLLENISDAVISTDENFVIRSWNKAAEQIYGWQAQEVIGRPVVEVLHTTYPEGDPAQALAQLQAEGVWKGEAIQRRRDGAQVTVLASVTAMRDRAGRPAGVVAVNRDITERRQAEAQARLQAAALEAAANAIVIADAAGAIEWANPAFTALTGYTLAESLGRSPRELLSSGAHDDAFYDDLWDTIRAGRVWQGELVNRRKDGALYIEEQSITPVRDAQGRIAHFVAVKQDVSERKRAAERIESQLERLAGLRAIDTAIASSFDLPVVLEVLLQHVVALLRVDAAAVLLMQPHLYQLEYAAGRGFRAAGLTRRRLRLGEGWSGMAALERRTVSAADLAQADMRYPTPEWLAAEGFAAAHAVPLVTKGQVNGVLEVYHRAPFHADAEWLDFLETLAGQAAIAVADAQLFESLQRSNLELSLAYDATIEGWSRAMDLRDKETEGHTLRVTEMTVAMARAAGLDDAEIVHVRRGALLHDMGKLGVPDAILLKRAELTDAEQAIMRRHPQFAFEMLSSIQFLRPALDIPWCHHERWDGKGYPRGLKGEQIPLAARLFAVVDVWDALRSDRPYRPGWPADKALEYIKAGSGSQFDPQAVELFLKVLESLERPA